MHILHVSSDFCNTKVYSNLYKSLSEHSIEQTIYCPVRNRNQIGGNFFEAPGTNIIYDYVVKPYHRYLYHIKRSAIFQSLEKRINPASIDLCHASTLFTDGGQAYKIYKKYHIPYIVAVRNTDVNKFLKLLPNTWPAGRKILLGASKIIFISKALQDKFKSHWYIKSILPEIQGKMVCIPNGIDNFFLDNIYRQPHIGNKVLYIGDFSDNKNVARLCQAILSLREEKGFGDITLTLVGGGRSNGKIVDNLITSNPNTFKYLGRIDDKDCLCKLMREHSLFAMPSIFETFGLVYVEALSQNLPIVYTLGQGIDGLFDRTVGVGVNPFSVDEIKNAIKTILTNRTFYSNNSVDFEVFRWKNISRQYINSYRSILNFLNNAKD